MEIIIWIGVAYVLGLAASRIGLPPLLGYLVGGFVLSAMGVEGGVLLHELAHYGVLFLLFTLGLHIRMRNMVQPEVVGTSLMQLIISAGLLTGLFTLFGLTAQIGLTGAIFLAVLLGVASTVVAAKGLENRHELTAYHGRVAIGILIIEDIILIGILAFAGLSAPSPWALLLLGLPLLRPVLLWLLRWSKHEELHLLYGLLLALGGAALFSSVGISEELGAFAGGLILAGTPESDEIADRMWSLREAFLIAFFLEIGLTGLPDWSGLLFALALVLYLPVRVALFFGLLTQLKLRARTSFAAATSLGSYSEFALITGAVAATVGLIPESMVAVLAVAVALSFGFGAPLGRATESLYGHLKPLLIRFERDVKHPDQQIVSLGNAEYLVVGMGSAGQAAYDVVRNRKLAVVGIDIDPARIEENRKAKRRIVYGDAEDPELWENMDMRSIKAVMLAIPNADPKVTATKEMRRNAYLGEINALTMKEEEYRLLREAGANAVCLPITQAGRKLAELSTDDNLDSAAASMSIEFNR